MPTTQVDGVILVAERRHVREKVGVLLERAEGMRLEGPGWEDKLEEVLEGLSFSERTALLATPINREGLAITLPAEDVLLRARTGWLPELLNKSLLYPYLQPIVSLTDGSTYGFESLIRGRIGDRELNGGEIVEASRAHGALFTLDLVGRTVALEQAMPKLAPDQVLFVNFTPTAIYDPKVCLRTTWAIARRLGLPMERICFEVVETEAFPDLEFLRRIVDEYRAQGAMVALDDLGGGHSSLSYLSKLRPDVVKIDRELITGLAEDPARQRLLGAMVDYAHELDIRVVAEGIETEDDLAATRALGTDLGQGWYLGRPAAEPVVVERSRVTGARSGHALRATLEVRDRALTAATSGVVIADVTAPGLPVAYVNPAFERLTGWSAADIRGRSCNVLQGKDTDRATVHEMRLAIRAGRECRVTVLNYRKDGTPFWCEVHLAPVRDSQGHVVQYVGVQNDVTDRVHAEMELREQRDRANHLARHDLLTGLPNRQEFTERAEVSLDRLTGDETAAVVFIDIDRFKQVNDHHGHHTGDEVLRQLAAELRQLCGPDVLLARQAGDEFLAFFTSPDERSAGDRVDQLVSAMSELVIEHAAGMVTVSAGASLSTPEHRLTLDRMLASADAAMYSHKRLRDASLAVHR
jgi:diguanylate cyclase (GGDEF)-like protein/PAS domain S-box-containing protein